MNAIRKDPAERYRSWLEFGKDLSQAFGALRLSGASLSDSEKFNELRQMPFFQGLGDVALWEVVRIGSWRKIQPGTVIIREGDQGDSFYLLIAGEVERDAVGRASEHHPAGRLLRRDPVFHRQQRAAHHHHHRARARSR